MDSPLFTLKDRLDLDTTLGNDLYALLARYFEAIEHKTSRMVIGNGHHVAQDVQARTMAQIRALVDARLKKAQAAFGEALFEVTDMGSSVPTPPDHECG